jgi:pimeloyl-ACP methyl ester carboxylesterase
MTQSFAQISRAVIDDAGDISRIKADQNKCPVLLITRRARCLRPEGRDRRLRSRVSVAQTVEVAGGGHDIHVTHTLIFELKVLS